MEDFDYKFWLPICSSVLAVWYTYNRTSKIETLKTQHQKQLHTYKEQFNKEYAIYLKIWEHIAELRRAYFVLHNLDTFANTNAFDSEKLNKNDFHSHLKNLITSYNNFVHEIEMHKPFYSKLVYDEIDKLANYLATEAGLMRDSKNDFELYKSKSAENFKKFEIHYEKVSNAISTTIQIG